MQDYQNIILVAVAAINIGAFFAMGLDKRKSIVGSERLPEVYFFFWAAFFGSLGIFLGMFAFRHKTRKMYFPVGIGLILLEQIFLLLFVFKFLAV
jgi:uncharacterized membrane protein YsdA (DUF1294 family)